MIQKGKRCNGQPAYIVSDTTHFLEQVPLNCNTFNEDWMQQLLYKSPRILPVSEIEPSFSPLIPIGREVTTAVGFIDNLYISPYGYLTIVETKLWRNPEAKREVVGQIIDYAKELTQWTFCDLDNAVVMFNKRYNNNSNGLIKTVSKYSEFDNNDQHLFIDSINKNLKRGRFLLLIVGDGIRESVEDMVEYLSSYSQLQFSLALIELQVYKFDKEQNFIVIPQVVTRTKEITRAIIDIRTEPDGKMNITVNTDLNTDSDGKSKTSSRFTITANDFFDTLQQNTTQEISDFGKQIAKDCEEAGYVIDWGGGSFSVKLLDPQGSGVKISLFVVGKKGEFYLSYAACGAFKKLGLDEAVYSRYVTDTAYLFPDVNPVPISDNGNGWDRRSSLKDLQPVYELFMNQVKKFTEYIQQ